MKLIQFIVKVKCTLVQALRLCTGRMDHRGSRGIALLFLDHGTIRGWGVSVTPRPLFTPGKDPILIVQEGGWAPGQVWIGAENLTPTGIRSPDRQARSQSPYRLHYAAHDTIYRRALNETMKTTTCTLGFGIWFRDSPKGLVCCYVRMLNVTTLFKSLVLMNNI
jgi:hypothetical protein